jgi:hypothetical protein
VDVGFVILLRMGVVISALHIVPVVIALIRVEHKTRPFAPFARSLGYSKRVALTFPGVFVVVFVVVVGG